MNLHSTGHDVRNVYPSLRAESDSPFEVLVGEDNPAFDGLFEFCSISAGGSIGIYKSLRNNPILTWTLQLLQTGLSMDLRILQSIGLVVFITQRNEKLLDSVSSTTSFSPSLNFSEHIPESSTLT